MNENKTASKPHVNTSKITNPILKRFKSQDVYNTTKKKGALLSTSTSNKIFKHIPEKKEISLISPNKKKITDHKNFSKIINDSSIQELDTEENSNRLLIRYKPL